MQKCYTGRRSHEKACGGVNFWDVVSTLTQDLTKARNQLARLMKEAKCGRARLYGGDRGTRCSLQPIYRSFTPPCTRAGSNLPPNRHRTPPPGHFMCGKQYPHYKSCSPERRRPKSAFGANPFGRRQPRPCSPQRASRFDCEKPRKRPPWSFEQPQPPYSCDHEKSRPVTICCHRQDKCEKDSNCIKISFNSRSSRRSRRTSDACKDSCFGPARLQGGGEKRPQCLGTQFATLLREVTCQLRERRLNGAANVDDDEMLNSRALC